MRYDGIYRIAAAYRKQVGGLQAALSVRTVMWLCMGAELGCGSLQGEQGKLVCRYLFMRSDNEPAPWITDGALIAAQPGCRCICYSGLRAPCAHRQLSCCARCVCGS